MKGLPYIIATVIIVGVMFLAFVGITKKSISIANDRSTEQIMENKVAYAAKHHNAIYQAMKVITDEEMKMKFYDTYNENFLVEVPVVE